MIRLIQRRLIIPRGDTGTFTVPVLATKNTGDVAVFSIIDTMTDKKVFEKIVNVSGDTMTIEFSHYDTVNLPVGKYVWDIKFYQNPEFMDGVLVNGVEVDSYYAAFTMPICEIRQTGDNLLMADDAPGTELTPDQLDILNAAVNETNAAKSQANESAASANTAAATAADKADEATAKAEEATAALNELKEILPTLAEVATSGSYNDLEDKPFIPSRVSDLTDDSGHYIKPVTGIPASDLEETYLTEHQDLSNYVQKIDYATVDNAGIVKINAAGGIGINKNSHALGIVPSSETDIKNGTEFNRPIVPYYQHTSAFYGLAKAAGDTTQSQSNNAVGTYTDSAKTAIQQMLGVPSAAAIPTAVSQLQNDSGYLTSFTETDPTVPAWAKAAEKPVYTAAEVGAPTIQEMNTAIGNAIGNINSFDMAVVQELPAQDISTHTIYLVPKTGDTNDVYDEYVYINNAWEMVGNTQIDLSNYVQKTDYATANSAGVVKIETNSGLTISNGSLKTLASGSTDIKTGAELKKPIVPATQHNATFYGLAKAAGDTTQSQSANAVGTYTDEAKAAIQQMLDVPSTSDIPDTSIYATKADTVLDTTLSRGRKDGSVVGNASFAFGNNLIASGAWSHAEGNSNVASGGNSHAEGGGTTASGGQAHSEGQGTISSGNASHAEGRNTISSGLYSHAEGEATQAITYCSHAEGIQCKAEGSGSHVEGFLNITKGNASHVEGRYSVEDSYNLWPEWAAETSYLVGDKVKITTVENNETIITGYICKIANSDAAFTKSNWDQDYFYNYAHIIGNGTYDNNSNAYALDWEGNGHYAGDVYVHANADSTGGTKLATIGDIPNVPVQDVQVNGTSVVTSGVANVPMASSNDLGAVRVDASNGVSMASNGNIYVQDASDAQVKAGTAQYRPISPRKQSASTFYGLSKAAGADMASSSNPVGTYTDAAKAAIQSMLGVSQMLAPVNPNMTAAQAYAIGDVFAANGKLYKATAAITADAAIIPAVEGETVAGANCEETNVGDGFPHDVQVNGTSVVSNGVANVPIGGININGVVNVSPNSAGGLTIDQTTNPGRIAIAAAISSNIKAGTHTGRPIVPATQHEAAFYGLAKAAGDTTQSASSNAVGVYTDNAKAAIKNMLGITQTLTVTVLTQDNVTVTGQTVTVRADSSEGEVYATAAYEGQPVSFSIPTGFQFYVSVSDTLDHHFNPTTAKGIVKDTNVAVTLQYSDFSTIRTAPDIKAALNAGMDLTDLVGEQITCAKDSDTLTWDVVDYDATNKSVKLLLHDAFGTANMVFEPAQALMWCENELAAGSYTFTWNTTQCYFTLTTAIPAGGQLRATNSQFQTYASQDATATLETGTVGTDEIVGATDLGHDGQGLLNHRDRVNYGSNNFAESALFWWLNSDAPAGTLRTPITKFSRAHSYAQPGFLNGLDQSFINCLDEIDWLCSTNNVYECPEELGGYTKGIKQAYTVKAKIGLASEMEIFGSYGGNSDGSTLFDLYNGAEADDRKKYRGTSVQTWWLRSPGWRSAHSERYVSSSGSALTNGAGYSYAVVPAVRISATN